MTPTLTHPRPVPSAAATDWVARPANSAGASARILYADDDPLLRQLGKLMLAGVGYSVDTVEDGAAAWMALNEDCYHLLITDHDMPHLTGRELIIQARRAGMRLPIVMTSGSFNPLENLPNVGSGLAVFLPKPFMSALPLTTVEQILPSANHKPSGRRAITPTWPPKTISAGPRPYGGINE